MEEKEKPISIQDMQWQITALQDILSKVITALPEESLIKFSRDLESDLEKLETSPGEAQNGEILSLLQIFRNISETATFEINRRVQFPHLEEDLLP